MNLLMIPEACNVFGGAGAGGVVRYMLNPFLNPNMAGFRLAPGGQWVAEGRQAHW